MHEHTAVDDSLAVARKLRQLVVDGGHVVRYFVVGLLQVHLAGELFTHLIERFSGPVTKPVEHTPEEEHASVQHTDM